jgi:uncharacterized protein (DUF2384 family)
VGKIDVTMLIPSEMAKLSPAERARRAAVADKMRRTLKPQNHLFGGGLLTIRRYFHRRRAEPKVRALAIEMIGDRQKAERWLRSRHRFLRNEIPLALIETDAGVRAVEQSLYAIAYGGVG